MKTVRRGRAPRRRAPRGVALIAAGVLLGVVMPSTAAASLGAPPVQLLPGLERARPSAAAGVGALVRYLPPRLARQVRSRPSDAAAAKGAGGLRVQVTVFGFPTATRARLIVARWATGARRAGVRPRHARVGRGGTLITQGTRVTIVWRTRSAVGLVQVRGPARPSRARVALSLARLAHNRLAAPPPATAWGRMLQGVRPDGTLPRRTAMQAFALAYGGLPGVRVPSGPRGAVHGTLAVDWILKYRSSLTARQRRVVDRALGLRPRGGGRAVAFGAAQLPDPTFEEDTDAEKKVDGYINDFLAKIGYSRYVLTPEGPKTFAVLAGTSLGLDKKKVPLADTLVYDEEGDADGSGDADGEMAICRVRLFPPLEGKSQAVYLNTLAHEAFHCVQHWVLGPLVWTTTTPPWISEGTAEWAADTVAPVDYPEATALKFYIETAEPFPPVFEYEEGYAAVGFFSHMQDALGDLWGRIVAVVQADAKEKAFAAAGGTQQSAYESWGSSRFRISTAAPDWTMVSPLPVPTYLPLPGGLEVLDGDGDLTAKAYSFANGMLLPVPGSPLVHVEAKGFARLLSSSDAQRSVRDGELWLRSEGDGACPPGWTGTPPVTEAWGLPSPLALAGPAGVKVTYHSLDEFCTPPPPTGDSDPLDCSAGGCGSSNGDPHLVTFDGLAYDFQAAGEFTLVRSTSGDLEVQARQEPATGFGGDRLDSVSINTALAMRVAGRRVNVYTTRKGMALRVDGRPVNAPIDGATLPLEGGGALAGRAGELAVLWPDGTELRVWAVGRAGLTSLMLPAPARAGGLVGLLGDFDGRPANDLASRGGSRFTPNSLLSGRPSAFRRLYRTFGASWRIRQRDSLFDYDRGRTTRSYTLRGFPKTDLSVSAVERRRAAAICRSAGVRRQPMLDNCIVDVAATGQHAFARDSVTLQKTAKHRPEPGPSLQIDFEP